MYICTDGYIIYRSIYPSIYTFRSLHNSIKTELKRKEKNTRKELNVPNSKGHRVRFWWRI